MNFEPSNSSLESWLQRSTERISTLQLERDDCKAEIESRYGSNKHCHNMRTLYVSTPLVVRNLPPHVSKVVLDPRFLNSDDISHLVIHSCNVRHLAVRLKKNDSHDEMMLDKLLRELNKHRIGHLKSISIAHKFPIQNEYMMVPLLRNVILKNETIVKLNLSFNMMCTTIVTFLANLLMPQGLSHLKHLSLAFRFPSWDSNYDGASWTKCRQLTQLVKRNINVLHIKGPTPFVFLSEIFPNLKFVELTCEDISRMSHPTNFQSESKLAFHHCIHLKLSLRFAFSSLACGIDNVETLVLDLRRVWATDDAIFEDLMALLKQSSPFLRELTILVRSMTNSQFLRVLDLIHPYSHFSELSKLSLDVLIFFDLDHSGRDAYLQMLRSSPTLIESNASFLDDQMQNEAKFICCCNKVQLTQLLRRQYQSLHPNQLHSTSASWNCDYGKRITTESSHPSLSVWPIILAALSCHPSIIFTLLKETLPEIMPLQSTQRT